MAKDLRNITPNNFVQWFQNNNFLDYVEARNRNAFPYSESLPVIISSEEYSYYLNFEDNYSLIAGNLELVGLHVDLSPAFPVGLQEIKQYGNQLVLNFQTDWNRIGVYRFGLKDITSGEILVFSQPLLFNDFVIDNSNLFCFNSPKNIGSFLYSDIKATYGDTILQKVRLLIIQKTFDYEQDIKQYRNATNNQLRNVNFYIDKILRFRNNQMSESSVDALTYLIMCSDFYVNSIGVTIKTSAKVTGSDLHNNTTVEFDVYVNGTILIESDFSEQDILIGNLDAEYIYKQVIN